MDELTENDILFLFFSLHKHGNPDLTFISTYLLGLQNARKLLGRDEQTGQILSNPFDNETSILIGCLSYLILLDQIGNCFKDKNKNTITGNNSLLKSLGYFSNASDAEKKCIYALRCALAHDYSLFNIKKNDSSLTHYFALDFTVSNELVKFPSEPWNGDLVTLAEKNVTFININLLGELIESINYRLLFLANNNELEIILHGGKIELSRRYFISFHSQAYLKKNN